jgi:two-component system, NarL family, nitrate/nitrite response regulator NarL
METIMTQSVTEPIRLLLVDDHALFRDGLVSLLEREEAVTVVGACGTAAEALDQIDQTQPAVILLDFDLGEERAVDFITAVRAKGFSGKILVVTAGVNDHEVVHLVQAGVSGILHKQNKIDALIHTIRKVANNEVCLEDDYLKPLFHAMDRSRAEARPKLTERDKIVLRGVFQGLANKEIGVRLNITEGAVKASLRQLCHKLGVRTRAQLVKVALEQYKDQL